MSHVVGKLLNPFNSSNTLLNPFHVGLKNTENYAPSTPAAPDPLNSAVTDVNSNANNTTEYANNLGRAELIKTSSRGVVGTDPVGRYSLLGNPVSAFGNS